MGFSVREFDLGFELRDVVVSGDVLGDLVVAAPVVVLGPGVELPVGDGEVACWIFDEDRAGVAEPDAVGLPLVEVEAGEIGSGAAEMADGAVFGVGIVDEDVDGFDLGEVANDFGVDPGDGLEFSGPVFGVVRPGDPGGGVRSPFGGHAVVGRLVVGAAQWSPCRAMLRKVLFFRRQSVKRKTPPAVSNTDEIKALVLQLRGYYWLIVMLDVNNRV